MHRYGFPFGLRAVAPTLAAAAALTALTPTASAAQYCVSDPACVSAGGVAKADFTQALAAAAASAEADSVRLGAGIYTGNYVYTADSPLTIKGAGRTATYLRGAAIGAPNYLRILRLAAPASAPTAVSDLSIELSGSGGRGLELTNKATAARVDVVGAATHSFGLLTDGQGPVAEHLSVDVSGEGNLGVRLDAENGVLRDATFDVANGVVQGGGKGGTASTTMQRVRIVPGAVGIDVTGGTLRAHSVLVDARAAAKVHGIRIHADQAYSERMLLARHLTVVGSPGDPDARGLHVESKDSSRTSSFDITDSVIAGFSTAIELHAINYGWAKGVMRNSFHGPFVHSKVPNGQGGLTVSSPVQVFGSLGFTDPAHGDFTLLASSPLVDAGGSYVIPSLDAPLDLLGATRVTDGDGDGAARPDLGAFERPAAAAAPAPAATNSDAAVSPAADPTPKEEAGAQQPVVVSAPPAQGDTTAPQISKLRVTTTGRGRSRKQTIRLRLTESSTVRFTLARRSGKRWIEVPGALTLSASTGGDAKLAVPQKFGGKRLKRAVYRLTAVARDAAGNTGTPQETTLKIG